MSVTSPSSGFGCASSRPTEASRVPRLREGFQAPLGGMLRMSRQMRPSAGTFSKRGQGEGRQAGRRRVGRAGKACRAAPPPQSCLVNAAGKGMGKQKLAPTWVDVGVVDGGHEAHLGRLEGVPAAAGVQVSRQVRQAAWQGFKLAGSWRPPQAGRQSCCPVCRPHLAGMSTARLNRPPS